MRSRPVYSLFVLALLLPFSAVADPKPTDVKGSHDHASVKRYPGATIEEFSEEKEFDTLRFPTGEPEGADGTIFKEVAGRSFSALYAYPPKTSCVQVVRNYENAFKAAGLAIPKGGGDPWGWSWSDSWIAGEGHPNGKGPKLYIIISCAEGDGTKGHVAVIEESEMAQKVEIDASAMAQEIEKSGHIALYGVTFATGKAEITAESAKTLAEIAKLLATKKDWKIRVEGHTDNVGKSAANLALSKKRAAAVKNNLIKKGGVSAKRLISEGYGDTKPVAPNTNDDSRAKNRRVELSKL